MPHLRPLAAAALALGLAAAGCDLEPRESSDVARDTWAVALPRAQTAASSLRDREKILAGRITALHLPDGVDDPPLAAAIADLQASVAKLDDMARDVEAQIASASSDVDGMMARHDRVAARKAVAAQAARLDGAITSATAVYDALEPRIAAAEQALGRHTAAIDAEVQGLHAIATGGGRADVIDLAWKDNGSELDLGRADSKAALDRLIAFAGACPTLRFAITGHCGREGDPAQRDALSLARADAVRTYLVAAGVAPDEIVKTEGAGTREMAAEEPEPGTPAAAALAPEDLAARQHANRRVTIEVVTPCPPAPPTPAP